MNMINVTGTTNGIALYNGDSVTCYPGSNQTDKGKLQLEFNMARFVTRLSSKNFCVTKPSFVVTSRQSTITGIQQLVVSAGQASINGMDLIVTNSITVNPPEQEGTFYLVMRLQRDDDNGTGNVLGDLVVGAETTFQGVCLTYYDEKDTTNPDFFYLAQVTWDGDEFTSIIEDEDKYGRIWAEDILAKINDPKHPNVSRLLLQEWIDKVPDWYVSKEGDVEFEAIEWLPGRQDGTYTSEDYGKGKYGVQIQAVDDNTTIINKKAASILESDEDLNVKELITNHKIEYNIGKLNAVIDKINNYALNITTSNKIGLDSKDDISINSTTKYEVTGNTVTETLDEHEYRLEDSEYTDLVNEISWIDESHLHHIFGKAKLVYSENNKRITVYKNNDNTETLTDINIQPDVNLGNDLNVLGDVNVAGEVTAAKVWNAVYNDYAEIFERDKNEIIEPGDVVCIRRDGLTHKVLSEKDFDSIIGICSDSAGVLLGGNDIPEEKQVIVGMCGKIWTKSNDKTIAPGDIVKVLSNGTIARTDDRNIKFGIAMTNNINGKVRIVYNG